MRLRIPTLATLALLLTACGDKEGCTKFAEHLADVVAKEKGEAFSAELREKMVKKTVDSCLADPPTPEALQCALKAETSEAMKACDPEAE